MYSSPNLESICCFMSGSNCCLLSCIYDFSGGRWGGLVVPTQRIFLSFVIHIIKGFCIVHKTEVDAFLEFSCFFFDPTDVGSLISGSSAFSKSSLNIWKFSIHVLLKASLGKFQHYFARVWDECNCAGMWTFLALPFFGLERKLTSPSPLATAQSSKFVGILIATLKQHHLLPFETAQLKFLHLH